MKGTTTTIKEDRHLLLWRSADHGRGEPECLGRILAWTPPPNDDGYEESAWMPVIHSIDTAWVYAHNVEKDVDKHGYALWVREAQE